MDAVRPGIAAEDIFRIAVETTYYELGWGGMMTEDTIVVTDSGSRRLTTTSSELIVVS